MKFEDMDGGARRKLKMERDEQSNTDDRLIIRLRLWIEPLPVAKHATGIDCR